jgi:hypothetical protein
VITGDQEVELTSRAYQLSRDRVASDQITETPAFVDSGCRHGAQHSQEPVMATVHVGTNTDPHSEHHSGLLHLKVGLLRGSSSSLAWGLVISSVSTPKRRPSPCVAPGCSMGWPPG